MQSGPPDAAARSAGMRSRLERYFEISVFLLLTSGFITIAGTGALDFPSVAFVSLALLVRVWFLLAGSKVTIPQKWDAYFTYGYVAFYAADYFLLARGFVNATVHLVLFSMVVKLFSVRRDRDYVYLAVLAFLEVLAASVLTIDSLFLAAFSLFALLAVSTFVCFEIRRSWNAAVGTVSTVESPRNGSYARSRFARSLSVTTIALLTAIFVIAVAMFFVLPRVTGGYFSHLMPRNRIESGFSEEVQLGRIGEIQQTNNVAMHIEIVGDRSGSHDLKWRGISLSRFDGRQWFNPLPRNMAQPELPGCYNVSSVEERPRTYVCDISNPQGEHLVHYRVLMEPFGANVFFLAPNAQSLSGKYLDVQVDAAGAVYNADSMHPIGIYEATSDLSSPLPERLRQAANFYPASIAKTYQQLPSRLDPRVQRLAREITADSDNAYDKAAEIERYLQTNLGYTLQLPQKTPEDPVADFLFERKAGHCEYFATAMAIMLRTIDIPSRIVNGFRGGEFNDVSGNYIVRTRDAHSWVEVYFPGFGWVAFDPTPGDSRASAGAASRYALYTDALREFWREWVINYDFGHQRTLGKASSLRALTSFGDFRRWTRHRYFDLILRGYDFHRQVAAGPKKWMYPGLGGVAVILILLNLRRIRRAVRNLRLSRRPHADPEAAASLWYGRMTRTVARRGWRKLPSQTCQEFIATIEDPQLRASVARFTDHYERARFADSAPDAQRLPTLFEAVRAAARQS